jgi:hypothetical protein
MGRSRRAGRGRRSRRRRLGLGLGGLGHGHGGGARVHVPGGADSEAWAGAGVVRRRSHGHGRRRCRHRRCSRSHPAVARKNSLQDNTQSGRKDLPPTFLRGTERAPPVSTRKRIRLTSGPACFPEYALWAAAPSGALGEVEAAIDFARFINSIHNFTSPPSPPLLAPSRIFAARAPPSQTPPATAASQSTLCSPAPKP